jgi:cytochrome oxidase Cu insertion factor (SCO1/SenC/PrrC family)
MPETAGKFEPLFITIDPERDGPKQLKDYLADWHPRMIGLTGNTKIILAMQLAYSRMTALCKHASNPRQQSVVVTVIFWVQGLPTR